MHELGIAINIVELVQKHLPADKKVQVKKIFIRAGMLTAIYPPALSTCVEAVARNTPVEGAEVVITQDPIRAQCRTCQAVSELEEPPFVCATCGGMQVDIQSGRDLFVESIEIEEKDSPGAELKEDHGE